MAAVGLLSDEGWLDMIRVVVVVAVLSVAALAWFSLSDEARRDMSDANQSRCAAYAAADLDCPYSSNK